jgi:transposase
MSVTTTHPDFTGQTMYIGIDAHKSNWKIAIRTRDVHLKTFSMKPSPEELFRHLRRHYPNAAYKSVYEAGFCGYWIHRQLTACNIDNMIVNPSDVPTTDKEREQKSDPVDGNKLSRELSHDSLKGIFIPDVHLESLRCLHRLYEQNTQRSIQTKNRIKGFLHFVGVKLPPEFDRLNWSNRFIQFLKTESLPDSVHRTVLDVHINDLVSTRKTRSTLLRQIREISKELPIVQLLKTVPGIGLLTAFALYVELGDISRFKNFDALAAYVGLTPSVQSSDKTVIVNGITYRHCSHLRSTLVESSWVAIRNDEALLQTFTTLTKRMPKNEAIIRIAKKLLNRIRTVWKNQTPYIKGIIEIVKEKNP